MGQTGSIFNFECRNYHCLSITVGFIHPQAENKYLNRFQIDHENIAMPHLFSLSTLVDHNIFVHNSLTPQPFFCIFLSNILILVLPLNQGVFLWKTCKCPRASPVVLIRATSISVKRGSNFLPTSLYSREARPSVLNLGSRGCVPIMMKRSRVWLLKIHWTTDLLLLVLSNE